MPTRFALALAVCALWNLFGCSLQNDGPGGPALIPRIDGPSWPIAHDPDLGELTAPRQQPVDFAVWPANDGTWQLWSCIRGTKIGGNSRLFHRWEGRNLTDPEWKPLGIAMTADPARGETPGGLQAPYVIRTSDQYLMFYGDWAHICLAVSDDGKAFRRAAPGEPGRTSLFGEGPQDNARDPMVLRIGNLWHCYYTAFPNKQGMVLCRTSPDLKDWSEPWIVSLGGKGGYGPTRAECPFVARRGGWYYLFRTQTYGENAATHVYRSRDPLHFNIHSDTGYVCTLPVAAPEIITHNGRDYIAYLFRSLKGIEIAKLAWDPDPSK